jgi:ATP-dependent helicase/nuclease subunit B
MSEFHRQITDVGQKYDSLATDSKQIIHPLHKIFIGKTLNSKQELFARLGKGATVITPNNRLSNQLHREYHLQQQSAVNDKPNCMPYQTFLRHQFNHIRHKYPHQTHPVVLNSTQQRHLWRDIIMRQSDYPCNDGLLHEIQEAWRRCQHWQVAMDDKIFSHSPQTRQFQQWQQALQDKLTTIHAITEEQLLPYILKFSELLTVNDVIWACFDDYTPQQYALQETLFTQGCALYHYELPLKHTTAYQYMASDHQDEWAQIIHWIQSRLIAGDSKIGVVVPDLQTNYRSLQRLLQRHIPQNQFNISLGQPLIQCPLVSHALTWLDLDGYNLTHHETQLLLQSPYLSGAQSELMMRAQFMQTSLLFQEEINPVQHVISELENKVPLLAERLKIVTPFPDSSTPQGWVDLFKSRLLTLGFPGEYTLNSETYQCFQRFIALFDEFLQLSVIYPVMTVHRALSALRDLATTTIFQTRTATSPILILGLLEASGCSFDSVWVCGLTDTCLPKKTNLSAFIPIDMQRNLAMPHAVISRELELANIGLQRFQAGSDRCVFSYSRMTGDMPNRPSPLITDLETWIGVPTAPEDIPSSLIALPHDYLHPLGDSETVHGGTSLLANQAMCPFRAFAAHRLHAKTDISPSTGPDASERGKIVHRIMELFWKSLKNQANLNALTPHQLKQHIEESIQSALTPLIHSRPISFPKLVQDVEIKRLHRLVNACIDWEKQRDPFVVEAVEQTFTLNLANINFQVRVDRLDLLESNKKWVIDYKTSIPAHKPWNDERPDAPQLLLYALLDETINALLFVQLKSGRLTCSGLSEHKSPLKGLSALKKEERWSNYRQKWHTQLTNLVEEFRAGLCSPTPTRTSTCEQCDYSSICRIQKN